MADELVKVRTDFVTKASKELLNQLLDDILDDRIVNDDEKDSIIEENNSRANRARCLIDTVKKKGDAASWKLIAHIKSRDPTLYCELGLSCAQSASITSPVQTHAAKTKTDKDSPVSLTPVTETFWKEKQNNKDIYPVTRENMRNRVALLINNIKFKEETNYRRGAEKDEENMEELLSALGYEVVKHRNLTAKAMDQALGDFSAHPKLRATDSVVVVIMSHGKLGTILGVEHSRNNPDLFPIDSIYKQLGSEKCPALLNKPKIIMIQACRRDPLASDGDDVEDDTWQPVHKEKDFIPLLSCTPDTVSYRDPATGSFLIQYVVSQFLETAHQDHVEELFRKVMLRFEDVLPGNRMQMPSKDRCTVTKHFYFFPGLSAV